MEAIRVLVVDDSADDRFLLARALTKTGQPIELFEVEDGGEAIDFFSHAGRFSQPQASPKPDLVFLDLKMPGQGGFEVLSWLQQHPEAAPGRVVVLSGSELEADRRHAQELGAAAYLTKPATRDQLQRLLAQVRTATSPEPVSAKS